MNDTTEKLTALRARPHAAVLRALGQRVARVQAAPIDSVRRGVLAPRPRD